MWLIDYNGRPLGRDMAMNLAGSIGEVAAGDRECQTLRDFRAHLEQIEDLASAGERIPRRYLLHTAAVGDAWLSDIGEDPVFVEGSAGSTREDRDWPWAH